MIEIIALLVIGGGVAGKPSLEDANPATVAAAELLVARVRLHQLEANRTAEHPQVIAGRQQVGELKRELDAHRRSGHRVDGDRLARQLRVLERQAERRLRVLQEKCTPAHPLMIAARGQLAALRAARKEPLVTR